MWATGSVAAVASGYEQVDRVPVRAELGESPVWLPEAGEFLWLDLLGRRVLGYDPSRRRHRIVAEGFRENLACLVLLRDGCVLLTTATGFLRLDPASGSMQPVALPLVPGRGTCFNDGKVAPDGSFWLGTSDVDEIKPIGVLSRITGNGVEEVDRGFVVSNGPAFSPCGRRAYFSDSVDGRILQYSLGESGKPLERSLFATVPEEDGLSDGLTVDSGGQVLSAHWRGRRVTVYGPDGRIRRRVPVPALNVTSCAFGGRNLSELLVTSAAIDAGGGPGSPEGDAFLFDCDTRGVSEPAFDMPAR
ncbi:MAG: SMP-30/gluconolactonase/LRE family protein [Boseongicola sp. SB0677_bin_26]|nr:SMP-30/gluconolactonase/LRE family protein [Boseongicola sp. SB0665_bin_10]MYG27927.1 SMP-30/gluconolactonase/LRE family protein [Boseongicola sp. SB0677_bin_26]